MGNKDLLIFNESGIYCPIADVYLDPWRKVDTCIISHAHSDHSRFGMKKYYTHHHSLPIMKLRLGENINVKGLEYGEELNIKGVKFSLHPAGHLIGSAQVRVQHEDDVWVYSGDYKLENDNVAAPFEAIKCNTFITECTFGLPIFNWSPQNEIFDEMQKWILDNHKKGLTSVILAYSLGKAQRIINNLNLEKFNINTFTHYSVENINQIYRENSIQIKPTYLINKDTDASNIKGNLVIAPPAVLESAWLKKLQPYKTAMASGWMNLKGAKRRRNVDKGFVISDHADWKDLLKAIHLTGAERIITTHGYTRTFSKYLNQVGYKAFIENTEFSAEGVE